MDGARPVPNGAAQPGPPCGRPKGGPTSATADRRRARFGWRLELGPVQGLVGAAGAMPGANLHPEVVEDPDRDGLSHPRRSCGGGAAAGKRYRPVPPLPVHRQQHPALHPAARRGGLLHGRDRGRVAAAAGRQDVDHVGRRRCSAAFRSACGRCSGVGPSSARPQRLICRRGRQGRRCQGRRSPFRRNRFPWCRCSWPGGGCSTPREQLHRSFSPRTPGP